MQRQGLQEMFGLQGHSQALFPAPCPTSDPADASFPQQEHPASTVRCTQHPKPPGNTAGETTNPVSIQGKKQGEAHNYPALWEHSHEQARAELELPEEHRPTWANTGQI